jgi:hypothetical protein
MPVIQKGNDPLGILQPSQDKESQQFDPLGILKKKVDGQDGGQKPKKDGIPPTQSQSQSQSPKGEEKPSWQTSALNPLVGVKKAEERKAQEPVKFVAKTPPVNVDNIKKYEASQQMYNLADKNKANILSKDEHSMFSPLPLMEDIAGALIPGYAENAKSKRYREITKADQDLETTRKNAMASQDALKQEIPKILSPVSDKWDEFISYTVDRVPKLDEYKIRDFANQTAKQYGVQEDGMFYNLIKREASNLITQKLIQPAVDEQLKINYKKQFGTNLDDDLKSESNQAALKLEEIKASAKASANKLQNQISLEARDKVSSISTDITNQVNALNDEMKIASEAINNNYSSLIKDGKFIGTQEQYSQYQQDFAALQQKEKENKQAFDALNKSFLDEQNLIFSKANSRYRREAEEISKIAQSQYEKFKPKANPQLQKNIEKIYYKSYDEVLNKNQELRRTMSSFNTPMENFTYNLVSSFGGWLKGQGANAGLEGVVTFGDFLQNSYAQDVTEFKSAKDYLDFQKLAKWSGQIIGGMLPGIAGAAAVTAATGGSGAPIGFQMIAAGATQWAAETYSNAGNIKADVLAATGDIAKANNAERQTIAFQKDILPLYSFSGLPFIGKPVSQLVSKYIPSAVRATSPTIAKIAGFAERKYVAPVIGGLAETLEELPQEYSQSLSEEAIRKEGSYENMFDYHTKEKLQNTALNIAPMFLFGGAGELMGQSEETKKQYATQQAAKSFALKTEFANLAPGQKEQFLFDVIQRQGAPFAAAYLTANYSSGQIDKATFEGMQQTYAKQVELLGKTQELGLTPVQAKLYNAFSTYYENEKQRFDETEDPIMKTIAGARMAEYQNAITNIAMQKEPNYSVVTYPDNTQMVFMHSELENSLKQPAFATAVANGDIKVSVFGESEKLNTQIEETKKSVVAAQEEEKKIAKEEEANTRKEIESEFNVQIEDNVGEMGVEVNGLGTEEQTQQAKQALRNAGIKLREDATENVTGLPSQVGEGQELVATEPQQGAGTEATGTGGVLQTQGVGGQVQGVGQKILAPISVSNKTELTGLEQRTQSDKNKSAVLASAKKAIATLKSVFPDMDIFIHEDGDAYNQTVIPRGGVENSRGNFAFERDKNDVPTGKGRIDINLSNASETTVAHEVTHAVLLKAFGDSPATFKKFRDRISPILRADLNKDLLEFEKMYEGLAVAPEEYLTQLSALLSKGAETVEYKPSTLRKIAAVINEFVAKITGGKFQPFKGEVDFKNFVDFLNQMAGAIEKGEVIETQGINGLGLSGKIVSSEVKSKSSLSSGDIKRFPVNQNVKVEEDVPMSKFNGKQSNLIESDRMTGGYISDSKGNPLFKFYGGVFYPIITGKWWASRNETKARAIAENGNKNRDADGYVYCTPMIGSDKQHMSNTDMLSVTVELMKLDVNDKKSKVKKNDVISSIEKAFNRKDVQNKKGLLGTILKKSNNINEIFDELEYALFQEGNTILDRDNNPILDKNGDAISNFTFEERLAIVNTILGDPKVKDVKFPSAGTISDAAKRFEEPVTSKVNAIGDVVTVMRTKGTLQYKKTVNTDPFYHKSYPVEIYAVDENGNPAEIEVYILDGAYGMKETFPSLTQSSGKEFSWSEYIEKHKSENLAIAQYNRTAKLSSATGVIKADKNKGNIKSKAQLPEQKIKSKSQFEEEKDVPLTDKTKKYEQQSKSTESPQGGKSVPKPITTGEEGVGKERPYNAESYSNPDGTPQYAVKRSDRDGGKRLDITVNGIKSKAKAVYTQSEQLKSAVNNYRNAYTDKNLIELDDANLFHKLITQSKSINKFGASVHVYEPGEYAQMRLFITPDGKAGVALKPDGDLVSGFSNQEVDKPRRIAQLLGLAIKEGAIKADSFDTVLPQYYIDFGLLPVAQDKWNEEFKPEKWDKEVFKQWNNGEPDVIYYVYKGGDRSTISERAGEFGSWKDLKKDVPYAEYDNAVKIQQQNIKSKSQLPQQVEKLRAEEQAELDSKIDNAEQYRVDGKVDRDKLTKKEDIKAFDEVYDKYDKLITPLLKEGVGEDKTEVPTTIVSKSEKTKVDFGEGEEGKDNKKEFDKLTSTIPNSGEVTKYLSGETIEKYEGEKPRNEQEVIAQQLRPALERGVDIIEKAKELFGEEYVEKLLQYVETENLPPANKALIYVSLENEVAKQKLENPSEAAKISKMQDLVRAKSQAFLRSNSLAINMGRLRKFAEVGYDVNRLTDRFFSSRELEDKKKIEDALQTTADDINKEAERIIADEENIKAKVDEGVKEEIQKIYENLSTEKKKTVDKRLSVLEKIKQGLFSKYTFKSKPQLAEENIKSKSSVSNIIEEGYNKIFNAIKAGIEPSKAIGIGVDKIKENIEKTTGQAWADEAEFRKDMTEAFKAEGVMEGKTNEKSQDQILKEQQKKLEAEINRQLNIVLKLKEKLARYESGNLDETDVKEQLKDVPEIEELKQKVKEAQSNYNKKIAEDKKIQDNIEKLEAELERVRNRKEKTPKEKTSEVRQLSEEEANLASKIKEENEAWAKEKENTKKLESQYRALETERNRQLERVSILKEKLEALKRGEKPQKNAQEVKLDTPEIEGLKADIKKEEKRLAEAEAKKEKTIAERLAEAKARVKNQIQSIQEQIANKQRVQKGDKLKPDSELENLIRQRDALNSLLDKYVPKVDAYADERNLKAAKTKLENEIIALNKQIQKGQKDKFEKKESRENSELDALRAEKEARQAILEALDPTPKLFIENTLIEQGFGRQINVKTKNGVEKRFVLDWKKLAGEEGSVDNIRERVESALRDKGYTDEQILRMQDAFVEEYNNLSQSIVEKALNEINARNKQATTPEQKSAVRKLVEMYNYGLFNEDPSAYETALAKTLGLTGISLENFERVRELGEVMSNLFNSNFEGKPLNESQLRSAIQVIEEKMRVILNSEAMQQGGTAFKLSEIVKGYMDASQRMMLNTIKQGVENPISGLLERFYSSIGYAGSIPEQLNAQQRKMARDIYKEMVLQKGLGYGNVGNAFISKGSLDAYIHNMSDSELVQGIMSVAMGKTILDAVDSAYKSKITQQKFTYNLIKILTKDRMVNGKLEKGMSKEEAKRYVAEKISGQSFEDAQDTAFDIIDKINFQAGKKILNDSPEFVSRLATDIVNAALVNGEKITEEMVTAAYNAAYRAAGRGLGHVANNPISEQINTVSGKLESRISDAIKQKKFAKATYLNLYSIFYRNIANPFVGGGTNWIVLKAEKTGLGLISGLISMYKDRGSKMDLMTDTGMKELEDVMFNSMKTKDKFMRGAVGGAVTALAFMLIKATGADDEYEKWIKKNQWAKKYLTILTPEIMLAMLAARQKGAYTKYLESSFNKNEAFDKGKMAIKAATYLAAGEKEKAAGQAGQLVGSSIGNPIPWRLVRDGQQIWVGATGGEPYAINPASPNTFAEGYLKGGFVDYLGYAPTSEDKSTIVSTKEFDSPAYKVFKEKEIKMPKVGERTSYEIPASVRENKQMTEEEFDKFSKSVKEYELNGWVEVDKITKRKTKHYSLKEMLDEKWKIKVRGKMPKTVLGRDLPKEDLQNKVNQLHSNAVEKAKEDLGFIKDEKEKRKVTQSKY